MDDKKSTNMPKHVAIIMDGNGRWAKKRMLSRTTGHIQGVETVKIILEACRDYQIPMLTLWAFGKENWGRPTKEVRNLFRLFSLSLKKHVKELHQNNVCLKIIGDRTPFHPALKQSIQQAEELTQHNTAMRLNLAINFSGKWDLTMACKKIAQKVQEGELNPLDITEKEIQKHLSLGDISEPDLLIRTSGVQRISNFLIWDLAYTEMYFSDILWPDFTKAAFYEALQFYQQQERRFGRTSEQLTTYECTT